MCIYIYILYIYIYTNSIDMHIYIYIYRERESERKREEAACRRSTERDAASFSSAFEPCGISYLIIMVTTDKDLQNTPND